MASTPVTYQLPQRIKPRSLRVGFFNANGLARQRDELGTFLRSQELDVFLVQESFLKPNRRDPRIANFSMVRNDRVTQFGGTLVYYKRSLHCIPLSPPDGLVNIEVSVCRLAMTGHAPITIVSGYLSPNKELLHRDLDILFRLGDSVLLAGDLNAKNVAWNCRSTNSKGVSLERYVAEQRVDLIVPPEPTHISVVPGTRPDILDLGLVKNVNLRVGSIRVIHELDSDHLPVVVDLIPRFGLTDPDSHALTKVETNWALLKSKLAETASSVESSIPPDLSTAEMTDGAIRTVTDHLQSVTSECSRVVPAADFGRRPLPADVRELVSERNAAKRDFVAFPTPERRTRMRRLQRLARRRIKESVNQRWEDFLSEIRPTHFSFWHLSRTLRLGNASTTMPPLDRPNQRPAFDDDEKAEYLADSLETQCSPSTIRIDPAHLVTVDSLVASRNATPPPRSSTSSRNNNNDLDSDSDPNVDSSLDPVTEEEVYDLIRSLPRRKAPGADGVSHRLIKTLPEQYITLLVCIFNAAFRHCMFPQQWKEATVIGFHKPGKPSTHPASYRPISLLSAIGKMYERLLLARLRSFAHARHLIPEEQFGFRERHSTVHQLLRITEHAKSRWFTGTSTVALFLDIAKAFDKVWHNGLLYKLYTMDMPTQLVHIIRDFLSNRGFRYRVEGTLSSRHTVSAGVPQGSALSPLLFSLYTSDIPRPNNAHLALFADDTALYASSRDPFRAAEHLQAAADQLGEWFSKWRIEVNPSKSQAILFHKTGRLVPVLPPIRLFGEAVPWTDRVKYLGVILDRRLSFRPHIEAVRARAAFAITRLHCLVNSRSSLNVRNKIRLYTACIRPIMTYASPVFAHASDKSLNRLQVIQNKYLRRAMSSTWYIRNQNLHLDSGLPTIKSFIKSLSRRYFDRAENHSNPLIRAASIYTPFDRAKWRRPRNVLTDPDDAITEYVTAMNNLKKLHSTRRPRFRPRRRGPRRVPRVPDPSSASPRAAAPAREPLD